MTLDELIKKYEIKIEGTDRAFDEELLNTDPKEMKNFRPSKLSILYGYKECYESVLKDLKELAKEQ